MDTKTIEGVELCRAGTWNASTGPVTITAEDIADAVVAQHDPEVDAAGVKIGHTSKLGDGTPALGWARNLRASSDGRTLIGDLVDVPVKLADVMPKAFRRRSAELGFGVRTPRGKTYRMALTAIALLGITPPAVKGLADVYDLYGLAAGDVDVTSTGAVMLAEGQADPARLEALAAAIASLDELELEEPARAKIVAELEAAAGIVDATIHTTDPNARHDGAQPTQAAQPEGTETMDDKTLRDLLKIDDKADIEAELTKRLGEPAAGDDGKGGAAPAVGADGKPVPAAGATGPAAGATAPAAGADAPAGDLVGAASLSAGTVAELAKAGVSVVATTDLASLTAAATAGAGAAAMLLKSDLKAELADAVRVGKVTPAEAGYFAGDVDGDGKAVTAATGFAAVLEANPAQGKALLAGLTPGKFATVEVGHDADLSAGGPDAAAWDEFEKSLLG